MISTNNIAKAEVTIDAPVEEVWDALINPEMIKKYMFGTTVISDWKEGSKIVWKGEWEGKHYEDKGKILNMAPKKQLQYSHFTPSPGVADVPENYHRVTYELSDIGGRTEVSLSQDNNSTEQELKHSQQMWDSMLAGLKKLLEK